MEVTYESTFEPEKELLKAVDDGLDSFNESVIGKREFIRVASFARSSRGALIGGISGWLFWDWLYVDRLWVDEGERGRGVGTRLMQEVERMALDRGVNRSHLCTASFQALDFYLGLGYSVFGQLEDLPEGHITYYMRRNL
jgi:GNAT superfamily N-acetyltransferase